VTKAGEFFQENTGFMIDIQDQALVAIIKIINITCIFEGSEHY